MNQKKFKQMKAWQKSLIVTGSVVEIGLLVGGLVDILRRSSSGIRGNRWGWTGGMFVSFLGPIAYFIFGRKRP